MNNKNIKYKSFEKNLIESIDWSDIVLFCSTSAGIEAMFRNKLTIYIDLNNYVNIDPLVDKDGFENILKVSTINELNNLIKIMKDTKKLNKVLRNQIKFANNIFDINSILNFNEFSKK